MCSMDDRMTSVLMLLAFDGPICANRFADSRESLEDSRTKPLLCESRFGALNIADHRFEGGARLGPAWPSLSGPISRDTAIVSLRYPLSRDTFSAIPAIPQQGAIPPLLPSFTQTYQCDTPFCNISRDTCAIPQENKHENIFAILSLKVSRDMKSIAAGPLRAQHHAMKDDDTKSSAGTSCSEKKSSRNSNFPVRKGWGQNVQHLLRISGKPNFWAGYPETFAGISQFSPGYPGCPTSLRSKKCVFNY